MSAIERRREREERHRIRDLEEAREKVRKDEVEGAGDAMVVAEGYLVQMVSLERERDTLKKEVE